VSDSEIGAYAHSLLEDVHAQAEAADGDLGLAFAELMLDLFCAEGHSEDTRVVRFKEHGAEISGWGVSSDDRCLDLFLTQYSPRADDDHKISRTDAASAFRRAENFLTRCMSGQILGRDPGPEVAEMCTAIAEVFETVETIRIVLITNARSTLREAIGPTDLLGRPVVRDLWDLRRLSNWATSGSKAEPIVAEFAAGLPCLATPSTHEDYAVFLAILPGQNLADLYTEHGARLLELNVRSFLQIRSGVNRGILDTIRSNPQRFLAYNNGISATASKVDFETSSEGLRLIRRIHNLQIVNGGQTTATIHHAARNQVDVGDVLVQMKLTVVSPDRLDDIVPQISAYSNTQNRVTASDLRANSGFHVEIERIMRTLWAPATPATERETHWFYERARGQYATALAREGTRARQRMFRNANPSTQRFTKSELAKYEHSWAMLPHMVSLGAEKNFVLFSDRMSNGSPLVEKDYCRHLVAKAILFRRADRLVARQNYGGYKANIVTYTIAKLVHATRAGLDLDRIWREQDLTAPLQDEIVRISVVVQKILTNPPGGRTHVGEWAKRQECWEAIRDQPWSLSSDLKEQLTEVDTYTEDLALIRSTRPDDWHELAAWGASTANLGTGDQLIAQEIARSLDSGWDPAGKHVSAGVRLMRGAREVGFRAVHGF
jgi:AIPR protein